MLRSLAAAAAASLAVAAGCIAPPAGPSERLAQSADAMNMATRFGRIYSALEHVASPVQDEFTRRHEPWGRDLWIVDLEILDVSLKASDEASVVLSVSWQRPDEVRLRVTELTQEWRDDRGGWRMTSEKRSGGDAGLLGDKPKQDPRIEQGKPLPETPTQKPLRASFQTRVIRAAD